MIFILNKNYILVLTLFFGLFGLFYASTLHAQVQDTDIALIISPQYPSPNQNATATLSSHVLNLDKANITWIIDNQELNRGIGMKSFKFKTGNMYASTNISATIDTIEGQSISKNITIIPAGVDLLYEAYDSYVPPFYKGKSLVPKQGTFKVVAMPNLTNQGLKVNPANLSYVWVKDDTIMNSPSGWGKNYFIFQTSYLDKENNIEVKVSDITGGLNASKALKLKTASPKVIFYRIDPLLGKDTNKALNSDFILNKEGETIVAEPYFFSPKDLSANEYTFDWYLGGEKIETPDSKNMISIKPEGEQGQSAIRLVVSNIKTLFQKAEKKINVGF